MQTGTYIYYSSGQLTDIRETWLIHTNSDSTYIINTDRLAPSFGSHIVVESHHTADHHITDFTVEWHNTSPGAVNHATTHYQITDFIHAERTVDGQFDHHQLPRPPKLAVMPLMRIFTGQVIRDIIALGGEASVLVPNITNPADPAILLAPLIETRRAVLLNNDPLDINGKTYPANCYQYTGGNYDESARFWLNPAGHLLRYTHQNWDIRLELGSTDFS